MTNSHSAPDRGSDDVPRSDDGPIETGEADEALLLVGAYVDGELTGSERERVARRLEVEPDLRRLGTEYRELDRLAGAASVPAVSEEEWAMMAESLRRAAAADSGSTSDADGGSGGSAANASGAVTLRPDRRRFLGPGSSGAFAARLLAAVLVVGALAYWIVNGYGASDSGGDVRRVPGAGKTAEGTIPDADRDELPEAEDGVEADEATRGDSDQSVRPTDF